MKITIISAATILFGALASAQQGRGPAQPGMTLTSTAFSDGGVIPDKYTQAVADPISPKLEWTNVPGSPASFVLLLHDPDVSMQKKTGDVLHWLVFNIPGTARELPEGVPPTSAQLPDGTVQAKNLRGGIGFMGPGAPPPGPDHHYTFELFALDTKLDLGPDASRDQVMAALNGHITGKAVLVGRFHRTH